MRALMAAFAILGLVLLGGHRVAAEPASPSAKVKSVKGEKAKKAAKTKSRKFKRSGGGAAPGARPPSPGTESAGPKERSSPKEPEREVR